jgi:hypothetical protein
VSGISENRPHPCGTKAEAPQPSRTSVAQRFNNSKIQKQTVPPAARSNIPVVGIKINTNIRMKIAT